MGKLYQKIIALAQEKLGAQTLFNTALTKGDALGLSKDLIGLLELASKTPSALRLMGTRLQLFVDHDTLSKLNDQLATMSGTSKTAGPVRTAQGITTRFDINDTVIFEVYENLAIGIPSPDNPVNVTSERPDFMSELAARSSSNVRQTVHGLMRAVRSATPTATPKQIYKISRSLLDPMTLAFNRNALQYEKEILAEQGSMVVRMGGEEFLWIKQITIIDPLTKKESPQKFVMACDFDNFGILNSLGGWENNKTILPAHGDWLINLIATKLLSFEKQVNEINLYNKGAVPTLELTLSTIEHKLRETKSEIQREIIAFIQKELGFETQTNTLLFYQSLLAKAKPNESFMDMGSGSFLIAHGDAEHDTEGLSGYADAQLSSKKALGEKGFILSSHFTQRRHGPQSSVGSLSEESNVTANAISWRLEKEFRSLYHQLKIRILGESGFKSNDLDLIARKDIKTGSLSLQSMHRELNAMKGDYDTFTIGLPKIMKIMNNLFGHMGGDYNLLIFHDLLRKRIETFQKENSDVKILIGHHMDAVIGISTKNSEDLPIFRAKLEGYLEKELFNDIFQHFQGIRLSPRTGSPTPGGDSISLFEAITNDAEVLGILGYKNKPLILQINSTNNDIFRFSDFDLNYYAYPEHIQLAEKAINPNHVQPKINEIFYGERR